KVRRHLEQRAKAAYAGHDTGTHGFSGQGFDAVHKGFARVNIDTRIAVGHRGSVIVCHEKRHEMCKRCRWNERGDFTMNGRNRPAPRKESDIVPPEPALSHP